MSHRSIRAAESRFGQVAVSTGDDDARRGVGAVAHDQLVEPIRPAAFAARAGDREHRCAGGDLTEGMGSDA